MSDAALLTLFAGLSGDVALAWAFMIGIGVLLWFSVDDARKTRPPDDERELEPLLTREQQLRKGGE